MTAAAPLARYGAMWRARFASGSATIELHHRQGHDLDPSTLWRWESGKKPHRLADRERVAEFVASERELIAAHDDDTEPTTFDLGMLLRRRRGELGLTMKAVAELVGCDPATVLHWEHGHNFPMCRFFPSIIRFLGADPWPEPKTLGECVRAERLRRGLSTEQVAAVLEVTRGSIEAWEAGGRPRRNVAKAKVDAFVTGWTRPMKRRLSRGGAHG